MSAPHPRRIVIATRKSALALWQAGFVRDRLVAAHPSCEVSLLPMTTQGDRILERPLADIGGKGLFIKELEQAMAAGAADIAVHSLKDVPMEMPGGFALAAILEREDARDALVSTRCAAMSELEAGSVVGTSSLRREAQIRERHPRLEIEALRGNVNTRLRKLDDGNYAAIVLAAAGLKRLGLEGRISSMLEPDESLPAVGQGALAIECRSERDDLVAMLRPLADAPTTLATRAERAFSRRLAGSCHTPIAAYGDWQDGTLRLRGLIASRDGRRVLRDEARATAADEGSAEALGDALARTFLDRGAREILDADANADA